MGEAPPGAGDCRAVWQKFMRDSRATCDRFEQAARDPGAAQTARLRRIVSSNRLTSFGQRFDFAAVDTLAKYRDRVPVQSWCDVVPWIERTEAGERNVLTAESPFFFERTSGSGAVSKHIPYTHTLLGEFHEALAVWLATLYRGCPKIGEGPAYWALSPATEDAEYTDGGVTIGNVPDDAYLGSGPAGHLLSTVLPVDVHCDANSDDWRVETLRVLIESPELALISVWSPTFLGGLLGLMRESSDLDRVLRKLSAPRRRAVAAALDNGDFSRLWPRLSVISCWMDGPSAAQTEQLRSSFPNVVVSPKGLLATEGVVSFPIALTGPNVLAVNSHVLEFVDDRGEIHDVDELRLGETYRPLLTTSGGLYRYRLGDIVEVDGWYRATPTVRFVGREDLRTDMVGEKLDESLVRGVLDRLLGPNSSACLLPIESRTPQCYVLLVPPRPRIDEPALAELLESELAGVFHYRHARNAGQLSKAEIVSVRNIGDLLLQAWEACGKRAGDFKASSLIGSMPYAKQILTMLHATAGAEKPMGSA